jgi:hypothetical protein
MPARRHRNRSCVSHIPASRAQAATVGRSCAQPSASSIRARHRFAGCSSTNALPAARCARLVSIGTRPSFRGGSRVHRGPQGYTLSGSQSSVRFSGVSVAVASVPRGTSPELVLCGASLMILVCRLIDRIVSGGTVVAVAEVWCIIRAAVQGPISAASGGCIGSRISRLLKTRPNASYPPRPNIDVPCAGRRTPAGLSMTADRTMEYSH